MKVALALLLLAAPLFAAAPSEDAGLFEDACYSEIGILCGKVQGEAAFRCVRRHSEALTPRCRVSIDNELKDRERRAEEAKLAREAVQAAADAAKEEASGPKTDARLVRVEGAVYLRAAGQAADHFAPAEAGMPLAVGDVVRTGADGAADLALDGESLISLAPNSDFIVDSLDPEQGDFFLGMGKLVAKLKKLAEGRQIRFATPNAVAAVRGTELSVEQPESADADTSVAVFDEGRVEVSSPSGGASVELKPNQETQVKRGKPPVAARPLQAMQGAKASVAPLRQRLTELRKQWKPQNSVERAQHRLQLAKRTALPAATLPKVLPAQRQRAYPEALKRQVEARREIQARPKAAPSKAAPAPAPPTSKPQKAPAPPQAAPDKKKK